MMFYLPMTSVLNNLLHRIKSMQATRGRLTHFLFQEESDSWLAILRIGLGIQVASYCLSLRIDWNHLFAGNGQGLISRDLAEAVLSVDSTLLPRIGWLVAAGGGMGISETSMLTLIWWTLFFSGCGLIGGTFCRESAVAAWFLHLSAVKSGELMNYGMDTFTTLGLFYLMISPLPDCYSFDARVRKVPAKAPYLHGFYRRVLQIHLCIVYFFSGVMKCVGAGWWNGESLWRALTRPPFDIISPRLIASFYFFLPIAGMSICLLETTYPIFIWKRATRKIWLIAIVGMHLTIGVTMGLYLFSLIMIVLNLAAFGPDFAFQRRVSSVDSLGRRAITPAR
jgi:hypothetical protein